MSVPITPAEGSASQTPEGQAPEAAATPPQTPAPQTPEAGDKATFTQADVDRILKERLARAVPADYEALKEKAGRLDQIEEAQKTELQKAQDAAKKAADERDAAKAEAARERLAARIESEAARQGADSDLVLAVLLQQADLTIDGVKDAVTKLLKDKPNLKVTRTPATSGGEFGGEDHKTMAENIAALEKKGDRESLAEARRLKIEMATGASAAN